MFEVKKICLYSEKTNTNSDSGTTGALFKILKKKYPYMLPIVQKLIALKHPLNTILTGCEQEKKSIKRKIRKDFYKIKQELGLTNYLFDDLRFSNFVE